MMTFEELERKIVELIKGRFDDIVDGTRENRIDELNNLIKDIHDTTNSEERYDEKVNKRSLRKFPDDPAQEGEQAERTDNLRAEYKEKISDLSGRLYYCSNTGEGRKMRRRIEREIKRLEAEIEILDQY